MMIRAKNNGRFEKGICKRFGYLLKLVVYPNGSDMKDLEEIFSRRSEKWVY